MRKWTKSIVASAVSTAMAVDLLFVGMPAKAIDVANEAATATQVQEDLPNVGETTRTDDQGTVTQDGAIPKSTDTQLDLGDETASPYENDAVQDDPADTQSDDAGTNSEEADVLEESHSAAAPQDNPAEQKVKENEGSRNSVENAVEEPAKRDGLKAEAQLKEPSVSILTHVQRRGWDNAWVNNGKPAGTMGKSLRMEAIRLRLEDASDLGGSIEYRSHVQSEGWQRWVVGDATSGSEGKAHRLEAIQIRLKGKIANDYDVWYRVHAQRMGWMGWTRNGETSGTAGKSLRLEALQVVLVKKGGEAPSSQGQQTKAPFVGSEAVSMSAHVQSFGWMPPALNGVAGTTGRGKRVEALRTSLCGARVPGGIAVQAHVQSYGWRGWVGDGGVAGTTGKAKRIEAIRMRLSGEAASVYDIYYRAHVQGIGWLSWAGEGETAGSEGMSLRVEAVQAVLVREGSPAPSNSNANYPLAMVTAVRAETSALVSGTWQDYMPNGKASGSTGQGVSVKGVRMRLVGNNSNVLGGIAYRLHTTGGKWTGWASNGDAASDRSDVDAIQVKLTGSASKVYDVWYRSHIQTYGWLGWTRNGSSSGSHKIKKRLEAFQVKLVPRSQNAAPGSTASPFQDGTLRVALDAASGRRSVSTFGGYAASKGTVNALNSAINGIRGSGYDVGFIMMDIASHKGVAYNCDALFYGASSIKAPYIASVVSKHPDSVGLYAFDMTETLFYSYDYNYKNVLAAYGKGPMRTWCSEAGVRTSIAEQLPWATYSARELAKMWARNYLLFSQSSAGEQFGRWCERPNVSTIHTTLGGSYRTRSKGGWIDAGGAVYPNINGGGQFWRVSDDGGIVYSKRGNYVVAIMSSVPANHDMLNSLTRAIDRAHNEM